MACRINKQREWVARLQLEMLTAPLSCFVTLTYDDTHLPEGYQLKKEDCQLWLKRLRERLEPRKIRYFLVGEYGEQTERPHYHVILYGVSIAESPLVQSSWTLGGVHVGTVGPGSLSYVCGYVLKKMTNKKDKRLKGRQPEFTLMSRKPGLGADSVRNLASAYRTVPGQVALKRDGYVSRTVRIGPKVYPLGRYLVGRLAKQLDLTEEQRKEANYKAMLQKAAQKWNKTTVQYESERKAKCQQQEGQILLTRAPWKRVM